MASMLEEIASKVKTIAARNPVYAEVVQWVGDLLCETEQVLGAAKIRLPELNFDPAVSAQAFAQGRAFLNPAELPLDWKAVQNLYRHLVEVVGNRKDGQRQAAGLLEAVAKKHAGAPALMKAVLSSDYPAIEAGAKACKIDPPVLGLLLRLSLRPTLVEIAQNVLPHLDLKRWTYGHCPVCGSAPKLADLSGEGGKCRLHCSLCEADWYYARMRCPFCENDNHEELSYLRAENEEGLRVDLCSRCGHYLKTIDLRELTGPIILPLDDVATWHLDIIAGRHLENRKNIRAT